MNKADMEPSLLQVLMMEEFSKIKLSDLQKKMYVNMHAYKNIFQEEITAAKKVILIKPGIS